MAVHRNWYFSQFRPTKPQALNQTISHCTGQALMPTIHRFNFPAKTRHATLEIPTDFDLNVSVDDIVEFETLPGQYWKITLKIFKVLLNNTIERVDYKAVEVEDPYP